MLCFSKKINRDFVLELTSLHKIRRICDGIDFFVFDCVLDLFKGDHKPSFQIYVILFNWYLFNFHVYSIHHNDDVTAVIKCPSCGIEMRLQNNEK